MRVLAIQLKRIGDLTLTTPALRALKAGGAHVTLAVTEGTAALLPMMTDLVDRALIYHTRDGRNGPVWRQIWNGAFDACVDFTGRERSALMTLVSRSPVRITSEALLRRGGWRRWCYTTTAKAPVRSRHTVDHYLDFLTPLRLESRLELDFPGPVLRLPNGAVEKAATALAALGIGEGEDFVVVHPGTARTEKYWVPERWAEVIAFCQEELGRRCVLTGGQHDSFEQTHLAAIRSTLAGSGQHCADLAGKLELPTLAAVLARAGLVVGVDSGPMHLAAAFRRPQVVLFGPTNPYHWRPRHEGVAVLRSCHGELPLREFPDRVSGGTMDLISTRAVIDCIKQATKRA